MGKRPLLGRILDFETFQAITRLRYEYALSLDTCNWPLHRSLYVDDVEMDFTSYSGGSVLQCSADEWVQGLRPLFTGLTATQHVMTNPVVELDAGGQLARQRMYMSAAHFFAEADGQTEFTIGGYYDDQVVLTAQGWRFRAVKLTVLWRRGDASAMTRARAAGEQQQRKAAGAEKRR